jgi:UPF0271 protein
MKVLAETGLGLLGSPHNRHAEVAAAAGVVFRAEGFADRGVRPDGLLIPRGAPGAELVTKAEVSAAVWRAGGRLRNTSTHAPSRNSK